MIYVFKFIFPKHQHCSFYKYREILLDQSTRSPVDDRSLPVSAVPVANVNRGRRENAAGGKEEKKRNGKETSDSFEDDFARQPSTSRGEIGRLKCHISARFD